MQAQHEAKILRGKYGHLKSLELEVKDQTERIRVALAAVGTAGRNVGEAEREEARTVEAYRKLQQNWETGRVTRHELDQAAGKVRAAKQSVVAAKEAHQEALAVHTREMGQNRAGMAAQQARSEVFQELYRIEAAKNAPAIRDQVGKLFTIFLETRLPGRPAPTLPEFLGVLFGEGVSSAVTAEEVLGEYL